MDEITTLSSNSMAIASQTHHIARNFAVLHQLMKTPGHGKGLTEPGISSNESLLKDQQ